MEGSQVTDFGLAVVLLSRDEPLAEAVKMAAQVSGGHVNIVTKATALPDIVSHEFPVLVIVDGETVDWQDAVTRCKLLPQTRQIPLHLIAEAGKTVENRDPDLHIDLHWERAHFLAELPRILDQHLHPPTIYPAGWDDQLSALAREGLAEFNRRDYFEQHEYLEAAWMAEERPIRELYQGILQVGVAFLQIERNNWRGALKMFRRGLPKLRALPPVCQGIELAAFRQTAERIHAEVTALGPERLNEFDQRRFPQIQYE